MKQAREIEETDENVLTSNERVLRKFKYFVELMN